MGIFTRRLPQRNEIILVFGVILFAVHGWSVRAFLYKLPAFSLYYSVGEIFYVFSYMMAVALLESIVITLYLIVPAMILPSKLLKEGFAYKGFLAVLIGAILSIWLQGFLANEYPPNNILYTNGGIAAASFVLLAFIFHKVGFLQKIALAIADRLGIMAYLYVPLGVIGILVYISRNLFHLFQVLR